MIVATGVGTLLDVIFDACQDDFGPDFKRLWPSTTTHSPTTHATRSHTSPTRTTTAATRATTARHLTTHRFADGKQSLLKWNSSNWMELSLQNLYVFIFGCMVGSFLNVVRHRLPRKQGIAAGRSKCPGCSRVIAWYDNIPLLSYIFQRGRCRSCGWRIPFSYFIMELATGVGFLLIWLAFEPLQAMAYWSLASILVACAGIDRDLGLIPDKLTVPGLILGLVFSVTLLKMGTPGRSLLHSVIGMIVGGGSLYLVSVVYKVVRHQDGMEGGDVMLMAMVGAFLDYKLALITIFVASLAGAIVGLSLQGSLIKA
jgi:leader peptidase (prepilin peptidase)/N-methyltransferase